jgi:hypothetical protein
MPAVSAPAGLEAQGYAGSILPSRGEANFKKKSTKMIVVAI